MVGLQTRYVSSATHNESAAHMLLSCPYSRAAWQELKEWSVLEPLQPYDRLKTWWNQMLSARRTDRTAAKNRATKFIYTTWNIWKERCHRVFENKACMTHQLTQIIKDDVAQWHRAHGDTHPPASAHSSAPATTTTPNMEA
jgi:hypothetical protein